MKPALCVSIFLCLLLPELQSQTLAHRIFLVGTVYDHNHRPVNGARIQLVRSGAMAVSRKDGRFRIFRPNSPDKMIVTANGYKQTEVSVSRETPQLFHLTLEKIAQSSTSRRTNVR